MNTFYSMDDVLVAVNEYVHSLNSNGGEFDFNVTKAFFPRKGGNVLRLSSSGRCGRQMTYEALSPEEAPLPDMKGLNIFMLGDVIHDFERYLISVVAPLHSVEKRVTFVVDDELHIHGHTDGVISLMDRDVVLDVKTASDSSFKRMLKEGAPEEYVYQMNAYLDALGLDEGYFWVYNKNDSGRMLLPIERNDAIVAEVKAHFKQVHDSIQTNTLPPRKYEPGRTKRKGKETGEEYLHFKCTWCPFVEQCWGTLGFKPVEDNGKTRWLRQPDFKLEDIL